MLDGMTHEQFSEWCAFDEIEPIGNMPVCEVMTAIGMLLTGRYGVRVDARHFMPWTDGEVDADTVLSPEQGAAYLRRLKGGT